MRLRKQLREQGLDAGPDTVAWHLAHRHAKSSFIRFEAVMPNECWQADVTHYRLAGGADAEILSWLDDCSRYALHIFAHQRVSGSTVLAAF